MNLKDFYAGRVVVVTGAAGFIGTHLTDRLLELGAAVRAMDHQPEAEFGARPRPGSGRLSYVRRSLRDAAPFEGLLAGSDVVFHLAANASVPLSTSDPALDFALNVGGTQRLLDEFRRLGRGRLVFASTASVYGEPLRDLIDEEHPLRPQSPYAGSKLAAEFLIDAYARCYDFDQVRLRLFSTFGPGQRKYVMFDLLEKLRLNPRHLEVLGTGLQMRTYSYVEDSVHAFLLVGAEPAARGQVFNMAGDRPVTIRELAELVVRQVGTIQPEISYSGKSWPGDIVRLVGDDSRLRSLGYAPVVGLEQGLQRLIEWYRREYSPPW